MKKSIVTLAIAASLVAPAAAFADATVYGNIHLTINKIDADNNSPAGTAPSSTNDELNLSSHTSAIGVKGSEDLGDGLKAIYKAEFQLDATGNQANGNALTNRDVFVGLKGGMGTIKLGAFSSNYKQMGGKVDALYRTPVEGRGFLHTQSSALHGGRGVNRGRQTDTVQYTSPKFSGIQLVANTTFSGADGKAAEETTGVGVRWSNKNILVYVDWIDGMNGAVDANGNVITESATKVGGKYSTKSFWVAGQYEDADKRTGFNYIHVNGGFNIDKNNAVILTVGQAEHITNSKADTDSVAVAFNHKLSKLTNVYVAYGTVDDDLTPAQGSKATDGFALGIKKKF